VTYELHIDLVKVKHLAEYANILLQCAISFASYRTKTDTERQTDRHTYSGR